MPPSVVITGAAENLVMWLVGHWPWENLEALEWGSAVIRDLARRGRSCSRGIKKLREEKKGLEEELARLQEEVNKTLAEPGGPQGAGNATGVCSGGLWGRGWRWLPRWGCPVGGP